MPLFETVSDLNRHAHRLRARAYGVIVMEDEYLRGVYLRPWPKILSGAELRSPGGGFQWRAEGNRCCLYYNQPWLHQNFLALRYIVSSRQATFKTVRGSLIVLDEIARLKGTDAIVCEVRNLRISDRLLSRWGWERHVLSSRKRHFIKRFYGSYPDPQAAWNLMFKDATR